MNETIAAIATPFGSGGIGVIRISGSDAFDIASKIFSRSKTSPVGFKNFNSHRVYHGYIFNPTNSDILDEILLIPMKAPASYTAEDIIEIQAHSGTMVLKTILDQVLSLGARLSEPGEFTKRAFLNQRIDLTQAEAVADIINAKSMNALKFASSQNLGALKTQIQALREKLIGFLSVLEANIDFPEDVLAFEASAADIQMIDGILEQCKDFIKQHDDASFLKEGIRITICGPPNVGKSSLMNRLLGKDRSIVTAIPGTTRDPIEEGLNIDGIPFVIADTAGIHQTDDLVEIIGIEKAKDHIIASDLVLFLKEPGSKFLDAEFEKVIPLGKKTIFVINKLDIEDKPLPKLSEKYKDIPLIKISALLNKGITELKQKIVSVTLSQIDMGTSSVIPNLRHKKALEQTVKSLMAVKKGLKTHQEEELLAMDIKNSIDSLGTITGETASLDILDTIFTNFCIGK
ncbi:MAG: tRNA uridine-5-carboxymethylaminomethyl(34) synthesis GTPase MnmE [Proteobacteria bacterium]|nr:tRNA uridine-5-carboxymethylaminomethyl(34) synthesis GTPase MnmE [Pseudomonadota bacterium]MBU1386790.1 tRNA uridine-5-carboxymethylaminomethyl(34) synthesis GTPase MnmE [Pseudomonadota bacterium]MBU1544734.1 tRNA uridine-5-carboxymethylaminomethyl(34) synthesis GTPase MnmE [Pseudomonadota bacterium]MBU2481903.1 tRNA uridine-5-carboxymethylaminomethyl(34) synthesis GTPase MnmE [Pseudomonadota bacterium]